MTEDRVTNETLQLASNKGLDWQSQIKEENPTQSLFQKFLREMYDVHIDVRNVDYWIEKRGDRYFQRNHNGKYEYSIKYRNISVCSHMGSSGWPTSKDDIQYTTYEEALEAGIQRAIADLKLS